MTPSRNVKPAAQGHVICASGGIEKRFQESSICAAVIVATYSPSGKPATADEGTTAGLGDAVVAGETAAAGHERVGADGESPALIASISSMADAVAGSRRSSS